MGGFSHPKLQVPDAVQSNFDCRRARWLSPDVVMSPVVGHLLPPSDFVEGTITSNPQFGLAVEGTRIESTVIDRHESGGRSQWLHLNGDMRQTLEALEHRMIEARVPL